MLSAKGCDDGSVVSRSIVLVQQINLLVTRDCAISGSWAEALALAEDAKPEADYRGCLPPACRPHFHCFAGIEGANFHMHSRANDSLYGSSSEAVVNDVQETCMVNSIIPLV